jgi:hypothetical protein
VLGDNADRIPAPSEGVLFAVLVGMMETDSQRTGMNRRPKISDSLFAVKWASILYSVYVHFQAVPVIRYDGKDMEPGV